MLVLVVIAGIFGAVLVRRRRKNDGSTSRKLIAELPELIDQLIVLLRAGYTPVNSCLQIATWLEPPMRDVVAEVNLLVQRGVRFSSAVAQLRQTIGPPAYEMVDALIHLDQVGLSATATLDRLSTQAHAQRRRRAEAAARELPIKLMFPMVCCVLPSFILLTVVPMLVGTLGNLQAHIG